jgi:hypothetical protein
MKSVQAALIIILVPLSLWAMTPLADSELSLVNGQAGVSIMPNITMDIHIDCIAWGDSDGLGSNNIWGETNTKGGYVGVTNVTITGLTIGPRPDVVYLPNSAPSLVPAGAKVLSHTEDYSNMHVDLTPLQNPLAN